MYKPDQRHLQPHLFSDLDQLPAKQRRRLEQSWAGTYRGEFHARLDESPFAGLYSNSPSRPNVPVRLLLDFETIKAGFGWSDQETYDHFVYDLQVRYAVGLDNLSEGHFELRTVYNFRRRVTHNMVQKGENPFDQAFAAVTDQQIQALALSTKSLRMDSTQVATNIRRMSRLQLMVESLRRVHRMLSRAHETAYDEILAPYIKERSGRYVSRIRGEDVQAHTQQVGEIIQRLLSDLAPVYGEQKAYQMLQRIFDEQFTIKDDQVQPKPGQEISANSLRSPDDPDATFRRKAGREYQGLVANVTETCDPSNPVQLVTKVQVASNTTEDSTFLAEALPELKERTAVETMYTDAGFCSREADEALRKQQVEQIPTDLRGKDPNPDKLNLADFAIQRDREGRPRQVTCPGGQAAVVQEGRKPDRYVAYFQPDACRCCPQRERCPARVRKRDERRSLRFDLHQVDVAMRRRRCAAYWREGKNLRTAIEAVMRAVKCPFSNGKLPVRGRLRGLTMLIGSAAMLNVRRINRYQAAEHTPKGRRQRQNIADASCASLLSLLQAWLRSLLGHHRLASAGFALSC